MEKEIIDKFIIVFNSFVSNVQLLCPRNSLINTNSNIIKQVINNNKDLVIKMYCKKVLIYKNEFDTDPNAFLMNHDFKKDLSEFKGVPLDQIFVFKNIWSQLTKENKDILTNYIKGMNKIASQYLEI